MTKQKKQSKKLLAFLLILGFAGGMLNHLQYTAKASEAEALESSEAEALESSEAETLESSEAEDNTTEKENGITENTIAKAASEKSAELSAVPATDEQIQKAWDAMTAAMLNWEKETDLASYNLTSDDMNQIWPDVAQDNPDLFYVLAYNYTTSPDGIVQKIQYTYNPQYTTASVAEYKAAIDRVFAEVIDNRMTDEQKAAALHDYLVQHMVYDQNANNNLGIEKRNAYEALVNGIGVCQGYTLAYAALLKKAGIEVDYCKSKSMNHIWNYVKLDGKWYHADLTYDDATASSQVGETGYVKHTYFLLSDTAMKNASHDWEPNGITCSDTRYDNSWHKTAPIQESAIYTVDGNWYYLKGKMILDSSNNPTDMYAGAELVRRDTAGNETSAAGFTIENLGSGWPMYKSSFSRLSNSNGVLYFNVGNSIYSFNPAVNASPAKIYQYDDAEKRIVTGLLVSGNTMTVEIYNPTTYKIEDKLTLPVFTLSASESSITADYTTPPVLTANPLATGFTWSKQLTDGSWETISGAVDSSYTIETGLPAGNYRYRVQATLNGTSVSAEIVITVTEKNDNDGDDGDDNNGGNDGDNGDNGDNNGGNDGDDSDNNGGNDGDDGDNGDNNGGNDGDNNGGNDGDNNGDDGDDNNDGNDSDNGNDNNGGNDGDDSDNGGNDGNDGDNSNGNDGNGNDNNGDNNNNNSNNGSTNGNGNNNTNNGGNNTGNNNAGGNSNASTPGAPTQSADRTKSPATGDTSPVMLYTLLAIASGSIMLKIYSRKKRPTHI